MDKLSDTWEFIKSEYHLEKIIGIGSFGEVVKARQKST